MPKPRYHEVSLPQAKTGATRCCQAPFQEHQLGLGILGSAAALHHERKQAPAALRRNTDGGGCSFEDLVRLTNLALESAEAALCREVFGPLTVTLLSANPVALRSASATQLCDSLVDLVTHPVEECKKAAIAGAAQRLDVSALLRAVPRGLGSGGKEHTRKWQSVASVLRVARIVVSSDANALERCRTAGGVPALVQIWAQAAHVHEVCMEAAAMASLYIPGQARILALCGVSDCVYRTWQRLGREGSTPEIRTSSPTTGNETGSAYLARSVPLMQTLAEIMIHLLPHMHAKNEELVPRVKLVAQSLVSVAEAGSVSTCVVLLQLASKMSEDAGIAQEFLRIKAHQTAFAILQNPKYATELVLRRRAAVFWVRSQAAVFQSI